MLPFMLYLKLFELPYYWNNAERALQQKDWECKLDNNKLHKWIMDKSREMEMNAL